MTTNRVLSYKNLDTVFRAGQQLGIGAAIKTELWTRPEAGITTASIEGFKNAVVGSTQEFPAGTAKVVWREAEHDDKDPHYTAVAFDNKDSYIRTLHIAKKT